MSLLRRMRTYFIPSVKTGYLIRETSLTDYTNIYTWVHFYLLFMIVIKTTANGPQSRHQCSSLMAKRSCSTFRGTRSVGSQDTNEPEPSCTHRSPAEGFGRCPFLRREILNGAANQDGRHFVPQQHEYASRAGGCRRSRCPRVRKTHGQNATSRPEKDVETSWQSRGFVGLHFQIKLRRWWQRREVHHNTRTRPPSWLGKKWLSLYYLSIQHAGYGQFTFLSVTSQAGI